MSSKFNLGDVVTAKDLNTIWEEMLKVGDKLDVNNPVYSGLLKYFGSTSEIDMSGNEITLSSTQVINIRSPYFFVNTKISGVSTPTADTDGANKGYVDVSLESKEDKANKGQPNGYPSLNENGTIPAIFVPGAYDDFIDVDTYADLPTIGTSGVSYLVAADETSGGISAVYRWVSTNGTGSYVKISSSMSAESIKLLYESNDDTNAFTDSEKIQIVTNKNNLVTVTAQANTNKNDIVIFNLYFRKDLNNNIAFGENVLLLVETAHDNVGIGYQALSFIKTGNYNVAIGRSALVNTLVASLCVSLGMNSLSNLYVGDRNVALGYNAGAETTVDINANYIEKSIYIGANSKASSGANDETTKVINEIVIGDNSYGLGNNKTHIGNDDTEETYIEGDIYERKGGVADKLITETALNDKLNTDSLEIEESTPSFTIEDDIIIDSIPTGFLVKGLTLNQIVKNGDFSDGTNNWLDTYSTNTVENNVLKNTGDGTNTQPFAFQENVLSTGKWFITARVRVTNSLCTQIRLYDTVSLTATISNPVENVWYDICTVGNFSSVSNLLIRHSYSSTTDANNAVLEATDVMAVPMTTSIFENYTEAQMLELVKNNGYIDTVASTGGNLEIDNGSNQLNVIYDNTDVSLDYTNGLFTVDNQGAGAVLTITDTIFKANTPYTLSASNYNSDFSSNFLFLLRSSVDNTIVYTNIRIQELVAGYTITPTVDCYMTCFINPAMSTVLTFNLMINKGTVAMPYKQYDPTYLPYTQDLGTLQSVGTAQDTHDVVTGRTTKNVAEYTFNASENVTEYADLGTVYRFQVHNLGVTPVVTNLNANVKEYYLKGDLSFTLDEEHIYNASNGFLYLFVNKSTIDAETGIDVIAKCQAWMSGKTLWYETTSPEIIDYAVPSITLNLGSYLSYTGVAPHTIITIPTSLTSSISALNQQAKESREAYYKQLKTNDDIIDYVDLQTGNVGTRVDTSDILVATTENIDVTQSFASGDLIDGVIVETFNYILVRRQTNISENGIYFNNSLANTFVKTETVTDTVVFVEKGESTVHGQSVAETYYIQDENNDWIITFSQGIPLQEQFTVFEKEIKAKVDLIEEYIDLNYDEIEALKVDKASINQDTVEIIPNFADIIAGTDLYFNYNTTTNVLTPKAGADFGNKHFTFGNVEPTQDYTIYVEPNGTQPIQVTLLHAVVFTTYNYSIYFRDYYGINRTRLIQAPGGTVRYETGPLSTTEAFRISTNINSSSLISSILL